MVEVQFLTPVELMIMYTDIIQPAFFSPHFTCFPTGQQPTSGMPYTAVHLPFINYTKEGKTCLINKKKSATQTRHSPAGVPLLLGGCSVILLKLKSNLSSTQGSVRMSTFWMLALVNLNKIVSVPHALPLWAGPYLSKMEFKMHYKHRSNSNRSNSSVHELYPF